ncbi:MULTISPECIES: hypothetical protein [unclassified Arenibacter]|uniref:hypothetical protein n=1 Tax=unclassified Arenibacter TaxID=2615047 RepID=UPI0011C0C8E4|nr:MULTISPECIES: hypothetical protein [unclassified Arenibacter]
MSTKRHYTDESAGAEILPLPTHQNFLPYCFYTESQKIIKNKKFRVEAVRRKVSFSKTESQ